MRYLENKESQCARARITGNTYSIFFDLISVFSLRYTDRLEYFHIVIVFEYIQKDRVITRSKSHFEYIQKDREIAK